MSSKHETNTQDTTTATTVDKKTSKHTTGRVRKTPWADRRVMEFTNCREKLLARTRSMIEKIPKDAMQPGTCGVSRELLLRKLDKTIDAIEEIVSLFSTIPATFDPQRVRKNSSGTYVEGDQVYVRERDRERYVGAFNVDEPLAVDRTTTSGEYVAVKTKDDVTFFVAKRHLTKSSGGR